MNQSVTTSAAETRSKPMPLLFCSDALTVNLTQSPRQMMTELHHPANFGVLST